MFFLFHSTITFSRKIRISLAIYEKRIQRRTKKCDFILFSLSLFSSFRVSEKKERKKETISSHLKSPRNFIIETVTVYVDLHQQADKNKKQQSADKNSWNQSVSHHHMYTLSLCLFSLVRWLGLLLSIALFYFQLNFLRFSHDNRPEEEKTRTSAYEKT